MMILKKENQIYKRQINRQKVQSTLKRSDRLYLSLIFKLSRRAIKHLTLVKPSTLLDWQRRFIKKYWTYKHNTPGRKPVSKDIKDLIMQMKQENQLWGCHRIADELKKLGTDLNPTTVNRIIQTFRKQGKIQSVGSWKKFLKSHWNSLFGMDFMTIDTLFGKRFYLLIILELKSRKIVRFDLTENPCREFVNQRIQLLSEDFPENKTLIYDNAPQFTSIDYEMFGLKGVSISPAAPNMNAYTERVNGSIRREALDHFLLFSEKQIRKVLTEYIDYYNFVVLVRLFYGIDQNNHLRPHHGIKDIPEKNFLNSDGSIKKRQILGGLHHHYYRSKCLKVKKAIARAKNNI